MRHPGKSGSSVPFLITLAVTFILANPIALLGQASYQAQVRGNVTDATGAAIPGATVIITETGTNVSHTAKTDRSGAYILRALRPSAYSIHAEAPGFAMIEQRGVVLAVDQETSLNFTLRPAGTTTTVEVREAAPLLDTGSSSLGTEITNEYVKEIPLLNRSFFGLVFLNAGVSETTGSGTADNYPTGTNFVSNGQRNATAEVRLDGALLSAPEEGEGGNTNIYYEPSVEAVQEFKVQNNSFSAEFGNNGGTVVNMALKSGTNALHGSGWWFGQRGIFDANDFFSNQAGLPRPDHSRNQYGVSLGGPVRKNKTFFFVDIERVLETDPVNIVATVPTPAERQGDFSQSLITDPYSGNIVPNTIFNPYQTPGNRVQLLQTRPQFPANKIGQQWWDPIGEKLLNLYPLPNQPGNPDGTNNFRDNTNSSNRGLQFDVKLDEQLSNATHLAGRYSHAHSSTVVPTVFGDQEFSDGNSNLVGVDNGSVQYDWNLRPTLLLTSRFSIDRVNAPAFTNYPSASSVGFPSLLDSANPGISRMPAILVDSPWTSIYDQCCIDTKFNHTQYDYSAALVWSKGKHNIKFGGDQRLFYNNFQEPNYPSGYFHFAQSVTQQNVGEADEASSVEGNPFADILIGLGDYGGIEVDPMVFNKSKETAFYAQDDWRLTPRLTINFGLRYEWSTPYSERDNRIQFSDFNGDSGITVPGLPLISGPLKGTTIFAGPGNRNIPVDRNNLAPRLGFAYQLNSNTVLRGGAGVYYGMNVATNYQYAGTAFRKDESIFFTQDNFATQYATLENPFPAGLLPPQGRKYGALAEWGLQNQNDLGTTQGQNADIYQWSFGIQRLLPGQLVVSADYSANHSTHLPWGGSGGLSGVTTRDRNFISSAIRQKYNTQDLYNQLHNPVNNPFQPLFAGPNAIFNEPDSQYVNVQIPLINLLRPYPQFDGPFEGLPLLEAESFYNALQVRFQKRAAHYISFEGGYTFAKSTDDSSAGRNAWIGGLTFDNPQELD
ncbi:MAG: TonB-dependent receptor, partial [Acidobacteriaceae bacterium]|nr:TonB-dependent receptor [Acidobacteriaceae bacterium]